MLSEVSPGNCGARLSKAEARLNVIAASRFSDERIRIRHVGYDSRHLAQPCTDRARASLLRSRGGVGRRKTRVSKVETLTIEAPFVARLETDTAELDAPLITQGETAVCMTVK